MNSLDLLAYVGCAIIAIYALTGFYIWTLWGWCGVRWIWQRRREIDAAVEKEIADGCRFHG